YINLHAQMIAVGGIFVFGFVTSWIFGREYADKTVTDLLALPYSRAINLSQIDRLVYNTTDIKRLYYSPRVFHRMDHRASAMVCCRIDARDVHPDHCNDYNDS